MCFEKADQKEKVKRNKCLIIVDHLSTAPRGSLLDHCKRRAKKVNHMLIEQTGSLMDCNRFCLARDVALVVGTSKRG